MEATTLAIRSPSSSQLNPQAAATVATKSHGGTTFAANTIHTFPPMALLQFPQVHCQTPFHLLQIPFPNLSKIPCIAP